jgi:hypothetical protein
LRGLEVSDILSPPSSIGTLKDIKGAVLGRPHLIYRVFEEEESTMNTKLTIHALDQVHCWDAYFRLRIGHYENFTPLISSHSCSQNNDGS